MMDRGRGRVENGKWRMEDGEWIGEGGRWKRESTMESNFHFPFSILPLPSSACIGVDRRPISK